ncbi:hypothetical protein AYK61_07915 [Rhodococcus sp. SBT000017]|nr:hypothetical protein AYK61_07915 [Rhodococcus sp. SBT000017]
MSIASYLAFRWLDEGWEKGEKRLRCSAFRTRIRPLSNLRGRAERCVTTLVRTRATTASRTWRTQPLSAGTLVYRVLVGTERSPGTRDDGNELRP